MNYKNFIIVFLMWATSINCEAQANLVPNPSFETYTACPFQLVQTVFTGNWRSPTEGTSDYYNACSTSTITGMPLNVFGNQQAYDGNAYVGIITYANVNGNLYREYIQTQLSSALTGGQTYYLSFYVSLADGSGIATDAFSAYVSTTPIGATGTTAASYANFTVTPQVSNPSYQFLNNALGWKQINGYFTASGGELYITIGNFQDDLHCNKINRPGAAQAYYYIDQVCLSQSPQTCEILYTSMHNSLNKNSSFFYNAASKKLIFTNPLTVEKVLVTNVFGLLIQNFETSEVTEADLSALESGAYLVTVTGSLGSETKKILIN